MTDTTDTEDTPEVDEAIAAGEHVLALLGEMKDVLREGYRRMEAAREKGYADGASGDSRKEFTYPDPVERAAYLASYREGRSLAQEAMRPKSNTKRTRP